MDFKSKAVSALLWSLWQQFSAKVLAFIISLILARVLQPGQFGLLAMLSVFIALSNTLLDSGLTASLIRTNQPDQGDYSTVFFFNLGVSVLLYCLLFITAIPIASFYHQAALISVLRVYGLVIINNAFFGVQNTLMIKSLKFKRQALIQVPCTLIGGIIGVMLAYLGMGVWSLVWMYLINSFLSTILHWILSPWKPQFIFDWKKFKKHFHFGYRMTLSSLLDTVFQNVYLIVIGKFFPVVELGFYSRADSISQFPVSNISTAINKAAYPVLAAVADERVKLKKAYEALLQQVMFWNAPTLVFLAVIAKPLFTVMLTEKWSQSAVYFQLLCINGVLYPLHAYNLNILKVLNQSGAFLRLEVLKKVLFIVGMILALQYGMFGLLYFQIGFNIIAYFINSGYSGKLIDYPVREQLTDIIPTLVLTTLAGLCGFLFLQFLQHWGVSNLAGMALTFFVFALCYLPAAFIFKFSALKLFNQLILKR